MNILLLSPFVPFPPEDGGRIRIYEILIRLARRHRVEVLTLAETTPESVNGVERLRREGIEVDAVPRRQGRKVSTAVRALGARQSFYGALFTSPDFATALERRLRSSNYDVVQCEFAYTASYAPLERRPGCPRWVLDAHNIEFRLNETLSRATRGLAAAAYGPYALWEHGRRRSEELAACRRMDIVVTVSDTDRDVLRRANPDLEVETVPNGTDLERFQPSGRSESERGPSALFVGKMDYRPNVDAVRWFCADILPIIRGSRPDVVLTICGSRPTPPVRRLARTPGVRVTGRVPDTRPYLDDASVVVVPLRAGSGTRLKILEALAMGRPVVATTVAAEGLDVVHGEHLLIADRVDDFAGCVLGLVSDPDERARLGRAGRDLVERRYGWDAIVSRLEEIHAELARVDRVGATP